MKIQILVLGVTSFSFIFTGCFSDEVLEETIVESVGFSATVKADQKKIAVGDDFIVTFNKAVDPTTVTSSSVYLVENKTDVIVSEALDTQCLTGIPITGTIVCAENKLSCTLSLDTDLDFNTGYLLCLLDTIKLAGPATGTFTSDSVAFTTIGTYIVSGTVSGLTGSMTLQNNSEDDLSIAADGTFSFATAVLDDAVYKVTISSAPSNLTCSVGNGSGTVNGANVTDVTITCSTTSHGVSIMVTGLTGTVVLQNNATDDLYIEEDGTFPFTTEVADGSLYAVTVLTHPTGQTCTVTNGSGTISGAAISDVAVACVNTYTVGGTTLGLTGTLVLQNNSGNDLSLSADGAFTFTTALLNGATYAVTIKTQPTTDQICSVVLGTGTLAGANITAVVINCTNNPKKIFITAATHDGDFETGFNKYTDGADAFCLADANKPATGTYKAILADTEDRIACTSIACPLSERVDWVLKPNTRYTKLDGTTTLGTTNTKGLFDFPLDNQLSNVPGIVKTGLAANWTTDVTNNCDDWSTNGFAMNQTGGEQNETSNLFIKTNQPLPTCNFSTPIYCVEQ